MTLDLDQAILDRAHLSQLDSNIAARHLKACGFKWYDKIGDRESWWNPKTDTFIELKEYANENFSAR
jgi:hypothetical protein